MTLAHVALMRDSQLFETLTLTVPGLVWVCDDQGRVEFNNAHWEDFTGMPQAQGLGQGWLDAIHPADAASFRAQLPLPEFVGNVQTEIRVRRHDGQYRRHLLNVRHVGDKKWVGCAIDAHDWLATELRDATQGNILEMVVAGSDLDDVLAEICRAGEKQLPGATCSILIVDSSRGCFVSGVAPGLPSAVMSKIPAVRIGTGVGSCGTAAFEKRDVISENILVDPLWDSWRAFFIPLGLRACWSKPVFDSDGEVIASLGFYFRESRVPTASEMQELTRLRDLTALAIERARVLEALRESEEHYRHTVEQNPQIPWTADPNGSILSVSSRWTEMTGVSQGDALSEGWMQALHPDDVAPTTERWEASISSGCPLDIEYRLRVAGGEYRWCRARATPRLTSDGEIIRWYGTVEDIHEKHLDNQRLKRQAYQDDLTGLPNRRRFVDELRRRLDSDVEPVGLLVLDIDDFKLVNDRFGHLTGDAVLRLFALYLQRVVAPSEFVARLGGDEFAILCQHISDEDGLLERARLIASQLDTHLKKNKKSKFCKPSLGGALGFHGENPDDVFKRADLALYAAKSSGKGTVRLYSPAIRSATAERSDALELARSALREGWIEPFYQPIINLKDDNARGFEALLRIRHPQRGLLAPVAILSAFDDPRLAHDVGVRMAALVVKDMSRWSAAKVPYGQVSINLATDNLINPAFIETLLALLREHDVPATSIKLEITEKVLMDDLGDTILPNLHRLREHKIGLSLDDFGTGYASLAHLQILPIDEIKIDRSFVSGLGSTNRGAIVQAMLGLARNMGISAVAEGIETQGEALKLASWGCDFGQGYFFSRPMPSSEVASFLDS